MKKSLLFILLVLGIKIHSQGYHRLLADSITTFNISQLGFLAEERQNNAVQVNPCTGYSVYAGPGIWNVSYDSLFKGKKYKVVYRGTTMAGNISGIMREDTVAKKVFFVATCDTVENLLYNFSLAQGDTIHYRFPSTTGTINTGTYKVDSIRVKHDYKTYYRKHFYLSSPASGTYVLEMIEGVGNVSHPLFTSYWFGNGQLATDTLSKHCMAAPFDEVVACKSDNGKVVYYDSCAYALALTNHNILVRDTCDYLSRCCAVDVQGFQKTKEIAVYPNPTCDILNCRIETDKEIEFSFSLVNGLGTEVKKFAPKKLQKGINEIPFNLKEFPAGIYLFRLMAGDKSYFKVVSLIIQ